MPKQNTDRSKSRIILMPKLHDDTNAADVWFEAGMIYFEDPKDRNEVASCTLAHFQDYIETLKTYVDEDEVLTQFVCGRQAVRRFIRDAVDLIQEVEPQLHVGLPIETIAEAEADRAGRRVRPGFYSPAIDSTADVAEFTQRKSGLIVPK
jgi:hypothetical protein